MRTLTEPVTNTRATRQLVQGGMYKIGLDGDGDPQLGKTFFQYTVMSLPSREIQTYRVQWKDIPAPFQNKLKEIHKMIVTNAAQKGQLLPGTDTDDL